MVIRFIVTFVITLFLASAAYCEQSKQQIPPAVVEIVKVQSTNTYDNITATGNLIAIPGIIIKSERPGRITNIYFNSGGKVKAGTSLVEVYSDVIKAEYSQAQAELKLAKLNFERMEKLIKTHTISEAEYDKAKSALESSNGKLAQYKANLDQATIRAAFDGKLGVSLVSLGQYISIGQDIVSLQSLDPIYVDFNIPEMYVSKVSIGQSVNISSDVYPNEVFGGKVHSIDSLVNKNTRNIMVRAVISNKEEKLIPGAFANVTLFISQQKQIIKIPQTAVIYDPKGSYVYKVINKKAIKTFVVTGQHDSQSVVIDKGLNIGDIVVVKGQMNIHNDGDVVKIL